MAQSSWPSPADSRAVSDVQYEQLVAWQYIDGLVGSPSDSALVFADSSGMHVFARAGRYGQVRGHGWTSGATDVSLTIGANSSGSSRTDLVVLGLNRSTWIASAYVKAGTPGAGAPALQLDSGATGIYEIPLAEVTVPNGASTISAGQVKARAWYVRPDGTASAGADTRPVNMPVGIVTTEGGDKLAWTGTKWVNLTSPPTPVQSFQTEDMLGSGDIAGDGAWHDFDDAVWDTVTFTVPQSGRAYITVSGWAENHLASSSTIWLSYRAAGGGMVPGVLPEVMNKRAIGTRNGRAVGSKRQLFTGLVPGATCTLIPAYLSSTASSDAAITTIRDGNLIMEPA